MAEAQRLNLNLASAPELSVLPGVGDQVAGALVRHRQQFGPFRSWAEVRQVPGVSPAVLDCLMDTAMLEPEEGGV